LIVLLKRCVVIGFSLLICGLSLAEQFSISKPGGPVSVEVSHVGPGGGVVSAPAPAMPDFRPPTMFSIPFSPASSDPSNIGTFKNVFPLIL